MNQFEIIGKETIKSLYSVLKPLLTDERHQEFFDDVLLPNWTSFDSFQDSQTIFLPIQNPNSDFRMNDRIFKYEESGFKEQNLKKLAKEGLYFDKFYGKKSKQKLATERQSNNLITFVDSVKVMSQNPATNISSFDVLSNNEDLYVNLGQNLGRPIPQNTSHGDKFLENIEDHMVDLEEVNKNITIETRRTNYTHRKKSKAIGDLAEKIKNKKRYIKLDAIVKDNQDDQDMQENKSGSDKSVNNKMDDVQLNDQPPEKQENKKNIKRKELQRDEIVLMLVFHKSENQHGHSVHVFIESGYSLGLLRRFSYTGTKVIGLKEYNLIQLEREQLTYPYDYPLTKGYQQIEDVESKKELLKY